MKIEMKPSVSLYDLIQSVEIQYDIRISIMDALDEMDYRDGDGAYFLYDYGNPEEDIYFSPTLVCIRNFLRDVIPNYKEVFIEV